MRKRIPNCSRPIFVRSPLGAMALTKLSLSKNLHKKKVADTPKLAIQTFYSSLTVRNMWLCTHFSPLNSFAFASKVRLHRLSSLSGIDTTVRTVCRAVLVRDDPSASLWTVGSMRDEDDMKRMLDLYVYVLGYRIIKWKGISRAVVEERERQGERQLDETMNSQALQLFLVRG